MTGTGTWAAPDSAPEQPAPPPASIDAGPEPQTSAHRDPAPVLPPVPVELRPMTVPDLLDGAFAILKRRPREVLTIAAALVIPVEVLSAVLLRDVLDAGALTGLGDPTTAFSAEDGEVVGGGAALTSLAIGTVSLVLLAGALGVLVDGWYRGRNVGAGEALAATLRRSPALIIGTVFVHLLEGIGLLAFGIGAYVAMALCHVASPAVTVESLGPFASIRRSVQLTRRRLGPALMVPGLVGLVGLLVGFGFQAVPELVTAVVPDDWDWLARSAGQMLSQLVVVPFTAGVAVLFHLDLRIRSEAHDISLRSRALLAG
jgi:hypothetical protein